MQIPQQITTWLGGILQDIISQYFLDNKTLRSRALVNDITRDCVLREGPSESEVSNAISKLNWIVGQKLMLDFSVCRDEKKTVIISVFIGILYAY